MSEFNRREICKYMSAGVISTLSGCSAFRSKSNLTLTILNYVEEDISVSVKISDDSELLFDNRRKYPASDDGISEVEHGVIASKREGEGVQIRATRHDVPFTDKKSVILNCTPEHNVSIAIGASRKQVEIIPSDCG